MLFLVFRKEPARELIMKRLLRLLFTLVLVFFLVVVALLSPVLAQPAEVWVDDDWVGLIPVT